MTTDILFLLWISTLLGILITGGISMYLDLGRNVGFRGAYWGLGASATLFPWVAYLLKLLFF